MKKAVMMLSLVLALVFILNIGYSIYIRQSVETANLYWGSRGNEVIEVQKRLKNWGYYDGVVDGIYGAKTYSAVRKFQAKNGLAVDGVVGDATKRALGIPVAETKYQTTRGASGRDNTYLLAQAIHGEARGEPYIGQVAVGAVILNRVNHPSFPNTIPGVIFQPGAFTAVSDGQIYMNPGDTALKAARDALNGWDPSGGAIYYYNPAKTTNQWIYSRPVITVIGKHRFAK
ncbi:MAG: Spore cortex-lytic enzyme, lytic transglycosylase SleB [Firmicutes bacterium]|nr:Spore cortex-lytic enzyme, lytic transglycosylase SleB [Bacillota bacterium]MDI6705145.1 spore cortex-lytic enzyme [Bacillota bacterium]